MSGWLRRMLGLRSIEAVDNVTRAVERLPRETGDMLKQVAHQTPASDLETAGPLREAVDVDGMPHPARIDSSAPARAEHFLVTLTRDDRSAFASLTDEFSLQNLIGNLRTMVALRESAGKQFSAAENKIIAQLGKMEAEHGGRLSKSNLQFRWVSATEDRGVPQLVEDAHVHGGAEPDDPWTYIGDNVVEDFMAQHRGAGVLFVYDGGKLISPSKKRNGCRLGRPSRQTYLYVRQEACAGAGIQRRTHRDDPLRHPC
ncbi:hypothetical protein ACFYO1_01955 [Nocardia sp. NPDC006044]|uniref:hypothetical protein n=1 Tax=Nocardia sp. NPDC006044 TaxID=3364306 RepID=UPI0036B67046